MPTPTSAELADRAAIHDLILKYSRGVDRGDYELIASVFHPGAIYHVRGEEQSAEAFARRSSGLERRGMMHFIGNVLIELAGDRAICEAYFLSFSVADAAGRDVTRTRAGRYCDALERRDGEWGVVTRHLVDFWSRLDDVEEAVPGLELSQNEPVESDIFSQMRAFLAGS
jgi:hypothetical protein